MVSTAGFTEIVELLLGAADNPDCVKRMLDTVDVESDTVSDMKLQVPFLHFD